MGVLGYLTGVLGYLMGVLGYLMGVLGYPMACWRRQAMAKWRWADFRICFSQLRLFFGIS